MIEGTKLGLSSPWDLYYREVEALFKHDKDIKVEMDDEELALNIIVKTVDKYAALIMLFPNFKKFGNVNLKININLSISSKIDLDKIEDVVDEYSRKPLIAILAQLFQDNPILSFIKTISGVFVNDLHYVVFKKEVVQYFADNLGDIYGQISTLYQDLAKDVIGELPGICYCTDCDKMVFTTKEESVTNWPLKG